jgi:hypothetical protein
VDVQWHLDEQKWTDLFNQAADEAGKIIENSKKLNPEEWQHAEQLGITETSRHLGILYAQWSIACERAALLVNGDDKQQRGAISGEWSSKGRGVMHTFDLKSMANRSSDLVVEHAIWSLPNNGAKAGNDLYSSLWAAIEGCMRSIASAIRVDTDNDNWEQRERCIRVYGQLFQYLRYNEKSPLAASLAKISQKPERWTHVVGWPFGYGHAYTLQLADEAKSMAAALNGQAKDEVRKAFERKIEEIWMKVEAGCTSSSRMKSNLRQTSGQRRGTSLTPPRYSSITRGSGANTGRLMTTRLSERCKSL